MPDFDPNETDPTDADPRLERALRWRLVLGRFADEQLPLQEQETGGDRPVERMDDVLTYLYDREFEARAHRRSSHGGGEAWTVPVWLSSVRELFPRDAAEVVERDALQRYGMTELVTDPEILQRAEPSRDLLHAILQFKHLMAPDVLEVARTVVAAVVEELRAELEQECLPALTGPLAAGDLPPRRTFRNTDWHRTIRRSLKSWDAERERIVPDRIVYRHRQRPHHPWRLILAVDQSGSMLDSVIHSAILAAIFSGVPAVQCNLVLWDHRVVDLTEHAHDPLEVLMGTQLGGGTRLLPALQYCAELVTEPERTLLVVVSDFFLSGAVDACAALAASLHESGVRGLGLCAVDRDGRARYDTGVARAFVEAGWTVAALTPGRLAEHVASLLRR